METIASGTYKDQYFLHQDATTTSYWKCEFDFEWNVTECQSARMSKIKNVGLEQYGAGPFEQQQFGTAGVEGIKPDFFTSQVIDWKHCLLYRVVWMLHPTMPCLY